MQVFVRVRKTEKLLITSKINHYASAQKDHYQSTDVFVKIDELSDLVNNAPIISRVLEPYFTKINQGEKTREKFRRNN